jgi:hypothetical protein
MMNHYPKMDYYKPYSPTCLSTRYANVYVIMRIEVSMAKDPCSEARTELFGELMTASSPSRRELTEM